MSSTTVPLLDINSQQQPLLKCIPVKYYVMVALIAFIINLLVFPRNRKIRIMLSNMFSILCCTAILNWLCSNAPRLVWAIVICQLVSFSLTLLDWIINGAQKVDPQEDADQQASAVSESAFNDLLATSRN